MPSNRKRGRKITQIRILRSTIHIPTIKMNRIIYRDKTSLSSPSRINTIFRKNNSFHCGMEIQKIKKSRKCSIRKLMARIIIFLTPITCLNLCLEELPMPTILIKVCWTWKTKRLEPLENYNKRMIRRILSTTL